MRNYVGASGEAQSYPADDWMLSGNDFSGRDQLGEVVWLDDQHVGGFAIGQFLENDRRGVEDEVNVLPTTMTERFTNFEQCRPERGCRREP
ncbi:MAG TPA: hypothetical protein VFU22_03410 [Roseiflexaceae bacterium]|nr:hypothetical protein [Roseiflexaceae bacterium]